MGLLLFSFFSSHVLIRILEHVKTTSNNTPIPIRFKPTFSHKYLENTTHTCFLVVKRRALDLASIHFWTRNFVSENRYLQQRITKQLLKAQNKVAQEC
tara:strand:+ start:851 stop:1144 length:294 start_codon:yes stop_codon:yes gene_type:complete